MNKFVRTNPFRILIVDDDPEDIEFARLSLLEHNLPVEISDVNDGQLVIDLLRKKAENISNKDLPQLILLDLNMPRKNGFEVLEELKEDVEFCRIPIVILSTSNSPKDISKAYDLGANCYIIKPRSAGDWSKTMQDLAKFWIQCATLSA